MENNKISQKSNKAKILDHDVVISCHPKKIHDLYRTQM